MLIWNATTEPTEQEDPYAAWDHLKRGFQDEAEGSQAICPVMIELLPSDFPDPENRNSAEIEHLAASFAHLWERINKEMGDPEKLLVSVDERQLVLDKQAKLNENSKRISGRYFRLIMVYVPEDLVYPRANSPLQENDFFRIESIGRAIPNALLDGVLRGGESGGVAIPRDHSIIGIIDDSFAFLNDAFIEDRQSLFSRIFFQDRERIKDGDVLTGVQIDRARLSDIIARKEDETEAEIYRTPIAASDKNAGTFFPIDQTSEAHQPLAFPISHGTHVTDTAVRTYVNAVLEDEKAANASEARKNLSLLGVTIPTSVTQDTSGQTISTYLQVAFRQIILWADRDGDPTEDPSGRSISPLVINFSYGFPAGPKDGSSKLNRFIAEMIEARNDLGFPTALVVPMGNSANTQTVARESNLARGDSLEVDWVIEPDDKSDNFLEIYARGSVIKVELFQPGDTENSLNFTLTGKVLNRLVPGSVDGNAPIAAAMEWNLYNKGEGDWTRQGFIVLGPTRNASDPKNVVPCGRWKLRITNLGEDAAEVLAIIQRDEAPGTYPSNGRQSYFDHADLPLATAEVAVDNLQYSGGPITKASTVSFFAANDSRYIYAVGAGMGETDDNAATPAKASPYASYGPRPRMSGPDVTALADRNDYFRGVYATGTYSGSEFAMSGASVAAPQLAGYLAANPELIGTSPPLKEDVVAEVPWPLDEQFGTVLMPRLKVKAD